MILFFTVFGFEIFILQRSFFISQGAVQIVVGLVVGGFFLLCTIVDHYSCLIRTEYSHCHFCLLPFSSMFSVDLIFFILKFFTY